METRFNSITNRKMVIVTVPPGTRWAKFHHAIREALAVNPIWASWDWIINDEGPMEDAGVEDMAKTGQLFKYLTNGEQQITYTVVVTTDRFFRHWALVMDQHYGNRCHLAAPSLSKALALLGECRGQGISSKKPDGGRDSKSPPPPTTSSRAAPAGSASPANTYIANPNRTA